MNAQMPVRRTRLAASLLGFAALLCLLPEAEAISPTWMYADEANGTRMTTDNVLPGRTIDSTVAVSNMRIWDAPYGSTNHIGSRFTITNLTRGCSNRCLVFNLGYTGGNPASTARYRIGLQASAQGQTGDSAINVIGNFEIRTNPTGKVVVITSTTGQPTEAGGTSTIRLRLSTAPSGNVTVAVSVSDTTEASLSTSSLTFTSTNFRTHQTVTVTGKDDSLYDGTKSYNVVFDPASTADVTYGTAPNVNVARTTTDDETAPTVTLALGSTSISENGGSTGVTASIGATDDLTEANIVITVGAASSSHYNLTTNKTLTIAAGQRSSTGTVSITAVNNSTWSGNKSVAVTGTVTAPAGVSNPSSQTLTITDNDTAPTVTLALGSTSISENGGSTGVTASIGATDALAEANIVITVGAASSSNYNLTTNKTLTIAAGQRSSTGTVTITAVDNSAFGASLAVTVTGDVTAPTGVSDPSSLTLTITNDDFPTLTISSPSVSEGDSGQTSMTFTVTRSYAIAASSTVAYAEITAMSDRGTATSGTDFAALTGGTLTFASGSSATQSFTVMVNGDTAAEAYETVKVRLSSATNAVLSGGGTTLDGTGTIENDDAPTVSIDAPTATEGDSGSVNMTFTVSLSYRFAQQVTVGYADAGNGTAASGTDYTAITAGTLTFAAGTSTTSQTITVSVRGDTVDEPDETIVVTLSSLTGGVFSGGAASITGTGTITDDETPAFSIDSPMVTEGDSGSVTMTFTVTLDLAGHEQTTVNYMDAGSGTATSGTDYAAITAGTLTFDAGDTSETFTVSITGDAIDEPSETVVVTLGSASTGTAISTGTGTGTITDNDTPIFSIDSPTATEGDSGSVNMTFTVTLSPVSYQATTVSYADAGTGTATSGTDYTAITTTTLNFAAGAASQTFTVAMTGDTASEGAETVLVSLSSPSSGTQVSSASGTGTGIIIDNEKPSFVISAPSSVSEGDSGSTSLAFTVSLLPSHTQSVTVSYSIAGTASSGSDYTASTSGTLTFAASDTIKTIAVSVQGDTIDEPDETVVVTLSNASTSSISIAISSATSTIVDDDVPAFSIDSPSVAEGTSGSADLTFTVTLSPASYQQVTVDYADAGSGTATSGTDYTAVTAGMLTFAAGESSKTIAVSVQGDANDEPDETIVILLSSAPAGTTISTPTGTGTITDDDTPTFSIDSPSVTEGDSGTVDMTFTVTLSPASYRDVTVDYADAGSGTATSGTDYTAIAAGMLTFDVGDTSKTITVVVAGDIEEESDETIVVQLSNAPDGTRISATGGTGTITNDDSSNNNLASLVLSAGSLSPGFSRSRVNYGAVVPYDTENLTVTPTVEDRLASVQVNGAAVESGSPSAPISLTEGENTIAVLVTAETGVQKTYTVVVTRVSQLAEAVLQELDEIIIPEVTREITASTQAAVADRIATAIGNLPDFSSGMPGGSPAGGLMPVLQKVADYNRARDRDPEVTESSLYQSLDGTRFVYATDSGEGGSACFGCAGVSVWGAVDFRRMKGGDKSPVDWEGELTVLNVGTDTMVDSGMVAGLSLGISRGKFGYSGGAQDTQGTLKTHMNTLTPYFGWTVSERASVWASAGYGEGKIAYDDEVAGALISNDTSMITVSMGGRHQLSSDDAAVDNSDVTDLKAEVWGTRTKIKANEFRTSNTSIQTQGLRIAFENYRDNLLESGATLAYSREAGVRWDGGSGDTGAGFEGGASVKYYNPLTCLNMTATARLLAAHESGREEWGGGLSMRRDPCARETGMSYGVSLSHGDTASGLDSLWEKSAQWRRSSSDEKAPKASIDSEIGYTLYGSKGFHTPYAGFGHQSGGVRNYRTGLRYTQTSGASLGFELERREAASKQPDNRAMLTGQVNW